MSPPQDPHAPPDAAPPIMPGVGSIDPPAPGTDAPGEADANETDPHPDVLDDFDDDAVGERESVESIPHKDG